MNKKALIIVSDTHVNSTKAIMPGSVHLDDGQTVHASPFQKKLWENYQKFIETACDITRGYMRIAVFNGDLGELDTKRRTYELVTPNKATIIDMGLQVVDKLAQRVDKTIVVRGTPAHIGKAGWLEEAIAKDLVNAVWSTKYIASHWHVKATVNSVPIDIAHHGQAGGYAWNLNAAADRLAHKTWTNYMIKGEKPPHIVIRSHMHKKFQGDWQETNVFFTPCWQDATDFTYRIGRENDKSDIGGLVILFEGNDWKANYITFDMKRNKGLGAL